VAGYFTDASMLRRVHRERALALYGPRALLMQAAHPLAVEGLLAHSTGLDDPYDRLARTAQIMETITFGSRADAERLTRRVRAMHARVSGAIETAAGPYPAGTPYRADAPELLLWVLFTLFDSAAVVYRAYVASLSRRDEGRLWQDYRVVGVLFGLEPDEMPQSLADADEYRREMLEGNQLEVSDWARERAREIVLEPPVPLAARPLVEAANFVTITLLPERIRREYGFSRIPPQPLRSVLVAGGAEYVKRALLPVLPARMRLIGAARAAA
jgi:uncharacterized protein (DUF2236 family)